MNIENQSLRLMNHTLVVEPSGRWILSRANGTKLEIPVQYQELLKLVREGLPLAKVSEQLRTYKMTGRFALLARFVCFLYDNDLLQDRRALQLAESLRPDHVWRPSLVSNEWISFDLIRWVHSAAETLLIAVRETGCLRKG